jgi:hypothetical protein
MVMQSKASLRTLIASALIIVVGAALALGADAASALTGTWSINLAKSSFAPGRAPLSDTRTYVENAQGVTVTVKVVTASGAVISERSSYAYDGKDYPISGNPGFDALSLQRMDARTAVITQKLSGKVVGSETRTVSADGKTMTISSSRINAKGMAFDRVAVYEKQ